MTRRRRFGSELSHELRGGRVPGEAGAAARARRAVLEAHAARPVGPRHRWRPAIVVAAAIAVAVLAGGLSSPGQAVGDWIRDVVERPAAKPGRPAPPPLPAAGRLLVGTPHGVGLSADGRTPGRVGHYREATWSPGGRFAAVTTPSALLAVTPHGAIRWRVAPPAPPRAPAWSPDGFRIAYLSGPQLRVVIADGTDDRLFRGHVEPVAPAFRPSEDHTVGWVDGDQHVRVADVDLARLRWRSPGPVRGVRALSWSADGRRLLVAGGTRARVFDLATGDVHTTRTRDPIVAAAFPPRGRGAPALLERRAGRSRLRLLGGREPLIETYGTYTGLVWSPDGRWILTGWASQWLLVRADGRRIRDASSRGRPLAWTR